MKSHFSDITFSNKLPLQIVVHINSCTLVLFNSGQFRIMGKVDFDDACTIIISSINYIYSDIITPLHLATQTGVFKLPNSFCPINLHRIAKEYVNDVNVRFEPEIFPAVSLHYWKPVHVNVFSTGKIVVLGKNAIDSIHDIYNWLEMAILFLPI